MSRIIRRIKWSVLSLFGAKAYSDTDVDSAEVEDNLRDHRRAMRSSEDVAIRYRATNQKFKRAIESIQTRIRGTQELETMLEREVRNRAVNRH